MKATQGLANVIMASYNLAKYNGYKIYEWDGGCGSYIEENGRKQSSNTKFKTSNDKYYLFLSSLEEVYFKHLLMYLLGIFTNELRKTELMVIINLERWRLS